MEKSKKLEITDDILKMIDTADAIYLIDFMGMTVEQVEALRAEFYKGGIRYKVVKNTLALRAIKQSQNFAKYEEKLSGFLKGPTGIVFAGDDPVAPAKIIKKFFDKGEKPKLKAAIVESEIYGSGKLAELASLLSKNELIAGILLCMESPLSGIVGSINAVMRDLSSVIEEAAKKKAA
ncbi:MAG TPA: 50S ribosomal protein L10 [Ignavibacteria bacterium]|jgi:large subunit ribosomal protein L10